MSDLSAVKQAGAFGAGDGSERHAVDDAGNELADALGVRQAGQSDAICDLSDAGEFLVAQVLFEHFLGFGVVGVTADLDGHVGYGVHAGESAHFLNQLIEGFGFADGVLDDFSKVFMHGMCSPDSFFHCALLGKNGRQGWPGFLAVYVVCFVWV